MISLEPGNNVGMTYEQPGRRPGTVTTAAVLVIVLHVLFALGALLGTVAGILLAVSPQAASQVENTPGAGQLVSAFGGGGIAITSVLLLAFSVLMILFSVKAMRGRNWARVVSSVFLALGVLSNLVGAFQPAQQAPGGRVAGGLLGLVLMALALVLYWVPPSNRWYSALRGERATATPPPQPGTTQG